MPDEKLRLENKRCEESKLPVAEKLREYTQQLLTFTHAVKPNVVFLGLALKVYLGLAAPAKLATQINDDTPLRYRENLLPLVSLMLAGSVNLHCVKIALIIELIELNGIIDRMKFGGTREEFDTAAAATMLEKYSCPALDAADIRLFQKAVPVAASAETSHEKTAAIKSLQNLTAPSCLLA